VNIMSFQKFKDAIKARTQKVAEMEKNFEDARRIAAYKTASRQVILEDYTKTLKDAIAGIQTEQERIRDKHLQARPTLSEQAQRATLDTLKFKAMTGAQLKQAVKDAQKMPPYLLDPVEVRALGAELRERGDRESNDAADTLAIWGEASQIDSPWVHDPTFKELQNRIERFKVYESQATEGTIITSVDQTISKDDIIRLDGGD
jgi:hypothetical protein